MIDLPHTLSGGLVGLIVGLTGVGGGSLMAPLLILVLGVAPTTAVGTDLWFAAITKMIGGAIHQRAGHPDWQVIRRLAYGSLPAAVATLCVLSMVGGSQIKSGLIVQLLGVVLIFTSVATLLRQRIHSKARQLRIETAERFKLLQPGLTILAGVVLGVLVTLTSVGAGALGATILTVLYPLRMGAKRLVGTDIIHAVPLTIIAGLGHFLIGNVDFGLLIPLLVGSIPGIIVGSLLATRINPAVLRPVLAVVLAFAGLRMVL